MPRKRGKRNKKSKAELSTSGVVRGVPPEEYYITELLALHPQLTWVQAHTLVYSGFYPEQSDSDDGWVMGPSALDVRVAEYTKVNKSICESQTY